MNGFGTSHYIDAHGIMNVAVGITRDQAMQLRTVWRQQLRWLEDVYKLPLSFETKAEADRRISRGGLPSRDDV